MGKYCYEYPRPALTTDGVIFGYNDKQLYVLLIRRGHEPYIGQWALPGGFVNMDETAEEGVKREVKEETGIDLDHIIQMHTFSKPRRDPRHRTVSVVYLAAVPFSETIIIAGDDASNAAWHPFTDLPSLAFDHERILEVAGFKLRELLPFSGLLEFLLGKCFSEFDLTTLFNIVYENGFSNKKLIKVLTDQGIIIKTPSCKLKLSQDVKKSISMEGFIFHQRLADFLLHSVRENSDKN